MSIVPDLPPRSRARPSTGGIVFTTGAKVREREVGTSLGGAEALLRIPERGINSITHCGRSLVSNVARKDARALRNIENDGLYFRGEG